MRLPKPEQSPGRLGTFTLLGAAAGGVPLPWVPGALARRVRGALVQDIAVRHGLSLSPRARTILADPNRSERANRATREAMRYLAVRILGRFGPARLFSPFRSALATFVLGHLFTRYLASREEGETRIAEDEAARLRDVIDRAMVHALTAGIEVDFDSQGLAVEELRDEVTQAVDRVLIATAAVPSWLIRRLDAAFDDMLAKR
jgi:hypothetical protein